MVNISSMILRSLIKRSNQRILIPFYHAVSDVVPGFVGDLYSPRKIADFEKDLEVLLEFYEPISLQRLIEIVKSKERVTKNYFHLTFDDGLSNFYENVAPILIKRKIPATVFLNTNFVDNKELFFRYKASLLFSEYSSSGKKVKKIFYDFVEKKRKPTESVSDFLFKIKYNNRELLDLLADKIEYSFSDFLEKEKPYLTKRQIKELINSGITFGTHSVDHPFYNQISIKDQIRQTKISMNWIEKELNIKYKAFSFPFADFGVSKSFYNTMLNEGVLEISFGTSGIKKDEIHNNLQRISFEIESDGAKLFLIKGYLKYFLRIPIGKSKMKR